MLENGFFHHGLIRVEHRSYDYIAFRIAQQVLHNEPCAAAGGNHRHLDFLLFTHEKLLNFRVMFQGIVKSTLISDADKKTAVKARQDFCRKIH